jgi:hypothetical protein
MGLLLDRSDRLRVLVRVNLVLGLAVAAVPLWFGLAAAEVLEALDISLPDGDRAVEPPHGSVPARLPVAGVSAGPGTEVSADRGTGRRSIRA